MKKKIKNKTTWFRAALVMMVLFLMAIPINITIFGAGITNYGRAYAAISNCPATADVTWNSSNTGSAAGFNYNGVGNENLVGSYDPLTNECAAVKFNVSNIPTDAVIQSATIKIRITSVGPGVQPPFIKLYSDLDTAWTDTDGSIPAGAKPNTSVPAYAADRLVNTYSNLAIGEYSMDITTFFAAHYKEDTINQSMTFVFTGAQTGTSEIGFAPRGNGSFPEANLQVTYLIPLARVTNVSLSNQGVASWSDISHETGYMVHLYRGATLLVAETVAPDTTFCNLLFYMRAYGAGSYTVDVTAIGDGITYADSTVSDPSSAVAISSVATIAGGLTWAGEVAKWNTVLNATSYEVQLYLNDNLISGATSTIQAADAASGADFSSSITDNGVGLYKYTVKAKSDSGLYIDGAVSAYSNEYTKTIKLSKISDAALSDSGVANWTDIANESGYLLELYKNGVVTTPSYNAAANSTSKDLLSVIQSMGAGTYTVTVTAKGDGTYYLDSDKSTQSSPQSLILLGQATGLIWNSTSAEWTAVDNAVSYKIELYLEGTLLDTVTTTSTNMDFSAVMVNGGNYTFKVQPLGNSKLILDGTVSAQSAPKYIPYKLVQVAGVSLSALGIASWTDIANEAKYKVTLSKDGSAIATIEEPADSTSHNFLTEMRTNGVGSYSVTVAAIGDGTYYLDGNASAASSGQTISKGTAVTTGIVWNGDIAKWSAAADAVSYDVQLYKGGTTVAGAVKNVLAPDVTSGADFSTEIANDAGGVFTYKVTAKYINLILDADASAFSDNNIKAIKLPQVTGAQISDSGVATWTDVANEAGYSIQLSKNGTPVGTAVNTGTDVNSYNFLTVMRTNGAGNYTITVKAVGDGTYYTDGAFSEASAAKSVVQINQISGLTWIGDIAHWTTQANASSYEVQLYQGVTSIGSPINVSAANAAGGADFSSLMSGGGTFYYKVTAKGNGQLVLDAEQSLELALKIVPYKLNQVSDVTLSNLGVASWTDIANEAKYKVTLSKDGSAIATIEEPADSTSHNFLTEMRTNGVGSYFVTVTAIGDGTYYLDGSTSAASSGQTISKGTAVTTGIVWNGDIAKWSAAAEAVSYDVQLYKGGTVVTGAVKNVLAAAVTSGADFSTELANDAGGVFTYKVTARYINLILDADASAFSDNNIKAIKLPQVTGVQISDSGVAIWTDVANEAGYSIQLSKNGTPVGTAVDTGTDVNSYNFLTVMRTNGAGNYTITVKAVGDGTYYTDGAFSEASAAKSVVQINQISGLTWTGAVAHWTTQANASSYEVQLYKDGITIGSPVNVTSANAGNGVNYSNTIQTAGNGVYTYKVTAKGNGIYILDSAQSAVSDQYVKVTAANGSSDNTAQSDTSSENHRQANVNSGDETGIDSNNVAKVDIEREEFEGKKVDSVVLNQDNAEEILKKVIEQQQDQVQIIVDKPENNPADEVKVAIDPAVIDKMSDNNIMLEVKTEDVNIKVPKETIQSLAEAEEDLYFRITPMNNEADRGETIQNAISAGLVQQASGNGKVTAVGLPMVIETNYKGLKTKVIFSFKDITLPDDAAERKEFLDSLAIYIKHSDGDEELNHGTIVYDKDGNPVGMEIEITQFSTFTIVSIINTAPVASNLTITGKAAVGKTLIAAYTYSDAEYDEQGISIIQWFRADNRNGKNKTMIKGASSLRYKVTKADQGKYLICEVTPVAGAGELTGQKVSVMVKIAAKNNAPVAIKVKLKGTMTVGSNLTASYTYSDIENNKEGKSIYRWYRADNANGDNKVLIKGATALTYTLTEADISKYIIFEVIPIAKTGTLTGSMVSCVTKSKVKALK